jgi:hypothetical protein
MRILEILIGSFLALLPLVIGVVARSKGRSSLVWGLLSVVLTPFGSLTLLLMLPEPDPGAAREPDSRSAKSGTLPGAFARIAFGDRAAAARHAELDEKLATETRDARVDRLIAERLSALNAAPALDTAPTSATAGARPTFGKRR